MAKPRDGTKSQAIQEYMAANPAASPQNAVEALKQNGIEVSLGLAKVVKYGKYEKGKKKTSAKESRTRTAAVTGQPVVTGSESIRQYIAKNPTAGPNAIELGLKSQGVTVSKALVNAVKYGKGRDAGKKRRSRVPVVRIAARMKRGEKTQAVRDYLAEHPEANRRAVVEGLKAKGIKVKFTLVSSLMYKQASKPGRRRAPSVQAAARKTATAGVSIEQLIEVKRFADSFGGADQVRQALDTLEQLR
jgi:hypothetical protein